MTVYRPFTEKLGTDPATFVGNAGELFYNAETRQVYISDGVTQGGVPIAGASSESSIQWTRFYFDRGGSTPTAPIANSENVGKNFGSWLEMTAGAVSGTTPTTGSSFTPTLSGITVNSNGEFELPAGVYEIHVSLTYRIENNSSTTIKKNHYLYGESDSDWAGSYDHHLPIVQTSNFSDLDHTINAGGVFVFENSTQANNKVYLQMGSGPSPVEPTYYPDYGFLNIRKLG